MWRLLIVLLPVVALAQTGPVNLGFEQGTPGQVPVGWFVPTADYSAEVRGEGCADGSGCVLIQARATAPAQPFGNLMQAFPADAYRGKTIRLRAMVRVEKTDPGDRAQMWLRVDRPNRQMGLFDNMGDRPITAAEWRPYEISGEVEADALSINIGFLLMGKAKVWVDGVTIEAATPTAADTQVRTEIQALYARICAAVESGRIDDLAAFFTSDAEVVQGPTRQPVAAMLAAVKAQIAAGTRYSTSTAIKGLNLHGNDAVVAVEETGSLTTAGGRHDFLSTSRDTWIRTGGGWKLKESVALSSHAVAPKFDPEAVKPVIAELKQRAVPLRTVEARGTTEDLAAFGRAVGDARIVALGEASHGTREFFQMKSRLLNYLVVEKRFTVFAIEANWPETLAVDRYIKSNEGDVAEAMSKMYFWTWYTEEVRDMIEWMRGFNRGYVQATGKPPILTFTAFDMQTATVAAAEALAYLKQHAPAEAVKAETAYRDIAGLAVPDNRAAQFAERAAAVLKAFDDHRAELEKASSTVAWRDARQAANVAFQACTMRIPGRSGGYRDEMMAANVDWLLNEAHPKEKIVLWAHNGHVRFEQGAGYKPMGAWLRERHGKDMYVLGFAFRQGSLRAVGQAVGGTRSPLAEHAVPPAPEGSGSAVLGSAGMPLLFLDLAGLPADGALAGWTKQSHLFYDVGAIWQTGDAAANLTPESLAKAYDGIVFVDEGHAARPLPPQQR